MKIINEQIRLSNGMKINIRYIFKEEERKTIAIVKFKDLDYCYTYNRKLFSMNGDKRVDDNANDSSIVIKKINEICKESGFSPVWNPSKEKRLQMHTIYTSMATCDSRDQWNIEIGKKVVTEKITKKLETAIINRMAAAYDMFKSVKIPDFIIFS